MKHSSVISRAFNIILGIFLGIMAVISFYQTKEIKELRLQNEILKESNLFKLSVLKEYDKYYDGAEELLDSCSIYLDWVDRWDNDKYYTSRRKIINLYNTQQ